MDAKAGETEVGGGRNGAAAEGFGPPKPRRWIPLTLIAAVVGLLGYAIVAISIGEGGPLAVELEGSDPVQRLYGGLPQDGPTLGQEDAPVTVSLFTDIQCGECGEWYLGIVPELVEAHVRDGSAKLELRHFSQGTRNVQVAAVGAAAAGEQGRQFQFAHLFILNQDKVPDDGVSDEYLLRIASAVPRMDGSMWEDQYETAEPAELVRADADLATSFRFPVGDAVIIEGPGGSEELIQSPSLAEIEAAIERTLTG